MRDTDGSFSAWHREMESLSLQDFTYIDEKVLYHFPFICGSFNLETKVMASLYEDLARQEYLKENCHEKYKIGSDRRNDTVHCGVYD